MELLGLYNYWVFAILLMVGFFAAMAKGNLVKKLIGLSIFQGAVFLLHGHGTGALKDGLRRWLRSSAYVADWCPADEDQGGDAFTIVQLA